MLDVAEEVIINNQELFLHGCFGVYTVIAKDVISEYFNVLDSDTLKRGLMRFARCCPARFLSLLYKFHNKAEQLTDKQKELGRLLLEITKQHKYFFEGVLYCECGCGNIVLSLSDYYCKLYEELMGEVPKEEADDDVLSSAEIKTDVSEPDTPGLDSDESDDEKSNGREIATNATDDESSDTEADGGESDDAGFFGWLFDTVGSYCAIQ